MPWEYVKHSQRAGRHGAGPMGHPEGAAGSQAEHCRASQIALDACSERDEQSPGAFPQAALEASVQ